MLKASGYFESSLLKQARTVSARLDSRLKAAFVPSRTLRASGVLLLLLAACSNATPTANAPRNPPTLAAPTQFVEAETPISLNNVADLRYLGRLDQPGTLSTIFASTLSPDATRLVGLNNEELLAWDLLTGKVLFETARGEVTRLFYASDKTEIYGTSADGIVGVYDANSGALKTTFAGNSNTTAVAFSADAGWLAVGANDGTIKVWDSYARQLLVTLDSQDGQITALVFSADGDQLVSAGNNGMMRRWRWRDSQQIAEHALDAPIRVQALAFSPDNQTLAIGTNRDAQLWSLIDATQLRVLSTGQGGGGQILRFAPNGRYLLTGNRTSGLSLWEPGTAALASRLPDTQGDNVAAAFSPDGSLLLTTVLGGQISLWNLVQLTGESVAQSRIDVGTDRILSVDWTDDGLLLLFFDAGGPVYLWGVG